MDEKEEDEKELDETYSYILEHYKRIGIDGEEKIRNRFLFLYNASKDWIDLHRVGEYVGWSTTIIDSIIIDYFADIVRLKEFHKLKITNNIKVAAYTTYWVNRRKPLFYKKEPSIEDREKNYFLNDVNEWFCLHLMLSMVYDDRIQLDIAEEDHSSYLEFLNALQYNFIYRNITPHMLELALLGLRGTSTNPKFDQEEGD
jgi:hypothetical protein